MPEKCEGCKNEARIVRLEEQVKDLEEGQNREETFRKTYYKDREDRIRRDADLDARIKVMAEQLDGIKNWVDEQKSKPAKRWDGIVEKALAVLVAAVVGFVLAKVGM